MCALAFVSRRFGEFYVGFTAGSGASGPDPGTTCSGPGPENQVKGLPIRRARGPDPMNPLIAVTPWQKGPSLGVFLVNHLPGSLSHHHYHLGCAPSPMVRTQAGTVVGAAVGVLPALFTFGLSIPLGAAIGGGAGGRHVF